jgi:hypothetical protein
MRKVEASLRSTMFERCDNCGRRIFANARRARDGIWCSRACQSYSRQPYFCRACVEETSDVSAGSTTTVNGVGTTLYGSASRCPDCDSVIQTKWFCIIYVPIIPLGRYRVLYASPSQYLSRQLGGQPRRLRDEEDDRDDYADERRPARRERRCPECGSREAPFVRQKVSSAGWAVFAVLLLFCFPLCWVGLLITEGQRECYDCGARL